MTTQLSDHAKFDEASRAIMREAVLPQIEAESMILRILELVPDDQRLKTLYKLVRVVQYHQETQS